MHASGYFSKVKVLFANLQNVDYLDEFSHETLLQKALTSNQWWVEHYFIEYQTNSNIAFSNIERIRTCSSFGNPTQTPYFWLQTNRHWTSNIEHSSTNYSSKQKSMKQWFFHSQNSGLTHYVAIEVIYVSNRTFIWIWMICAWS